MKKTEDLSLIPPNQIENQKNDFIKGATDEYRTDNKKQKKYPWEEDRVRPDLNKQFPLYISEDYYIKIDWIRKKLGKSKQEVVRNILLPNLDIEVDRIKSLEDEGML